MKPASEQDRQRPAEEPEDIRALTREMRASPGLLLGTFASRFFGPIRFSLEQENLLQGLARQGHLVYVMQSASVLHYLFLNFWCLRLQLPLAAYGNGIPAFVLFQPLGRLLKLLFRRLGRLLRSEPTPPQEPFAPWCERRLRAGKSLVLFLRHSRLFRQSAYRESKNILETLAALQVKSQEAIFLVPIGIIWGKWPEKVQKSVVDTVLGDKTSPGFIRQMLMLVRYSRHSVATVGQVINLRVFQQKNAHIEEELLLKKLRWSLYRELALSKKQIAGPRLKPRKHVLQSVLSSRRLRELAREVARAEGKSFDEVMKRASRYADEIVADYSSTYIRFLDWVLTWVWNNIYSGLYVDKEGIDRVKKASRKGSLILLPSHRSHVDYLVLSYVFHYNELPLPHVAAGVNLSFWPLGRIFRKAGAFFIRRSFRGLRLYAAVFSAYVRKLLQEGYVQEFFLEGTRSRTGKMLYPRLGMLTMEMESFSEGAAEDVYLVPISIHYDKVVEESSYLKEAGGAKKEKEKVRDLLKMPKFLRKKYGRVYIQFAPPISVREYLQARQLDFGILGSEGRRVVVESLALRVTYAVNQVTTVTPPALVAMVLLNHPARGITQAQLMERVDFLLGLLREQQARLSLTLQNLTWAIEEALGVFVGDKIVQRWDDPEGTIYTVEEANRTQLNYYKNSVLHHLLPHALALNVFRLRGTERLTEPDLLEGFEFLRRLLAREFIFPPENPTRTCWEKVRDDLAGARRILAVDLEGLFVVQDAAAARYVARLMAHFFEAYYAAIYGSMQVLKAGECEERTLVRKLMDSADRLYRRGDLHNAECRSVFLVRNAVEVMTILGFLQRRETGGRVRYLLRPEGKQEMQVCLEGLLRLFSPHTENR